jgi:tRNA threonylcarbamoyladenosine biosynthesis protein TsaE
MGGPTGAALASELRTLSAEETHAVGRRLGMEAAGGTLLALIGPLGAGKTQLAKGVADGLGVTSVVNSPTFVLMNEHVGRLRLFHIDAYRLDEDRDPTEGGLLDDRQATGVTVIEWADRIEQWLPAERLEIEIEPVAAEAEARVMRWRAVGEAHADLARRALGSLAGSAGEPSR